VHRKGRVFPLLPRSRAWRARAHGSASRSISPVALALLELARDCLVQGYLLELRVEEYCNRSAR
jgi:hypothetical protein